MDKQEKAAFDEFLGPSMWLKFTEDNDFTLIGIYRGAVTEDDPFNPGEKRLVFDFEIDKEIKKLGSGSRKLAKKFIAAKVKAGDTVRIVRYGEGFDTNYDVKVVETPQEAK